MCDYCNLVAQKILCDKESYYRYDSNSQTIYWKIDKFLIALGIPLVGPSAAKEIAKKFKTWTEFINSIKTEIQSILNCNEPLTIKDLAINGVVLEKEMNLKPSKEFKMIFNFLLDNVLKDPSLNNYDSLILLAKNYKNKLHY